MATTGLHPGGFPQAALWSFSDKNPAPSDVTAITALHPGGIPMAALWSFSAKNPAAADERDNFVGYLVNINRMMLR